MRPTTPRLATLAILVTSFASALAGCAGSVDTSAGDVAWAPGGGPASDPPMTGSIVIGPSAGGAYYLDGQCLPHAVALDPSGAADCFVLELRATGGACSCDAALGLAPVAPEHVSAIADAEASAHAKAPVDWDCACDVQQIHDDPADAAACEDNTADAVSGVNGQPLDGFCYVDPGLAPPHGPPGAAKQCPVGQPRLIHFVGAPAAPGSQWKTLFISCEAATAP